MNGEHLHSSPDVPKWADLEKLLEQKHPVQFVVDGSPDIRVIADGTLPSLSVRSRVASPPDLRSLERLDHMAVRVVADASGTWLELVTGEEKYFQLFAALLPPIVEKIRSDGLPPENAMSSALEQFRAMLRTVEGLSRKKEIGLLGELWFLQQLLGKIGCEKALEAWLGPLAEDHDFRIGTIELEVKATSKQSRQHWISSLQQLKPSPGAHLYLLSLHLALAGAETGADGLSLAASIDFIRSKITEVGLSCEAFDSRLAETFNLPRGAEQRYRTRFVFRAEPSLIRINEQFPSIRREDLRDLDHDETERILRVKYQLDCEGLGVVFTDGELSRLVGPP